MSQLGYLMRGWVKDITPPSSQKRQMVQQELGGLLRRLSSDPALSEAFSKKFTKATVLSEEESLPRKYFLAHHSAYKGPNLRVDFYAAAHSEEMFKNDAILSGLALQPSLSSGLIQLREGAVTWASDIEASLAILDSIHTMQIFSAFYGRILLLNF
jgi:hypothetical protein